MPRNPDGSASIRAIGDHLDYGNKISAECNSCQRRVKLDLEKLAEQLGRDHSALVGVLGAKLKCSGRSSKGVSFKLHVNAGWKGTGGHSLSRK